MSILLAHASEGAHVHPELLAIAISAAAIAARALLGRYASSKRL